MHRHYHEANRETYLEHYGPWGIPCKARVLCSDGIYRIARTAQTADTWFSLPARVTVKGKTVSGYVTSEDNELVDYRATDGTLALGYHFHQYLYGKNHAMLPAWTTADGRTL